MLCSSVAYILNNIKRRITCSADSQDRDSMINPISRNIECTYIVCFNALFNVYMVATVSVDVVGQVWAGLRRFV